MLRSLSKAAVLRVPLAPRRALATSGSVYQLPDLSYDYGELEPFISAEIMELHHSKHHKTYVSNLNLAIEQYDEAVSKKDIAKQIALQGAIKFNGGGHINHSIFWANLAPAGKGGGGEPTGSLAKAINDTWGSFDAFKATMNTKTAGVQGSGWGWLVYNPESKGIQIATLQNQDPVSTLGLVPLLGIDVWEHAYYLQYKNVRPDYLKNIWNVINWSDIQKRYETITN